jgi:O-antigen/teichoic acid export membrane protein
VAAIGAIATLVLAIAGFGVWALVSGTLITALLGTIGLNLLHPFPHWPLFAFKGLRKLFAFGGYVAISRVFLYLYLQADMVIGGRLLGKEQIGYYSVGMHLASLPMQRVSSILNDVAFPAFSRLQDDSERVAHHLIQAIRLASLFSFPVFWGIGAVAPEIVGVFLGDKWEPAILPLQLLAIVMPLRMIGQLMPPSLQGVGKAQLTARNQLVVCVIMVGAFLIGAQFGIVGLSVAWLVGFPFTFLANLSAWFPALGIRMSRMWGAMAGPAIAGTGMFATVAGARAYGAGHGVTRLITLIAIGAISYGVFSLIVNRSGLREARSFIMRRMSRSI